MKCIVMGHTWVTQDGNGDDPLNLSIQNQIYNGEMIHFQGKQLCQNCFVSFRKGVYSIRKEFVPIGSKFFPYRVNPFQKGLGMQKNKQEVIKVFSLCRNAEKIPNVFTPLNIELS